MLTHNNDQRAAMTLRYSAPELVKDPQQRRRPPMDIWALGMVLYQLFTCRVPYYNVADKSMLTKCVTDGATPRLIGALGAGSEEFPPHVLACMQRCWDANPHARPSAADVLGMLRGQSSSRTMQQQQQGQVRINDCGSSSNTNLMTVPAPAAGVRGCMGLDAARPISAGRPADAGTRKLLQQVCQALSLLNQMLPTLCTFHSWLHIACKVSVLCRLGMQSTTVGRLRSHADGVHAMGMQCHARHC